LSVYEIPELYKALALAYERAGVDEAWRVAYSRVGELVARVEKLQSRVEVLGLDVVERLRGYSLKVLRSVEGGDVAVTIEAYWEFDRALKSLETRANVAFVHVILARIASSAIVAGVGLVIALNTLSINAITPSAIAFISVGVALGSLLLLTRRSSHQVLALAALLQLAAILALASLSLEEAIRLAWLTLLTLTAATASLGVHVLMRRILLSTSLERSF